MSPPKIESDASRALKEWCRTNISAEKLSRRLGFSRSMVSSIANGYLNPSPRVAVLIESECGIAADSWPKRARNGRAPGSYRTMTPEECALPISEDDVTAWAGEDSRAVAFCPGVFVTRSGRVIRATRTRGIAFAKPWVGKRRNGKLSLTTIIKLAGRHQKAIKTARLVCLAFHGSPPDDERTWALHRDDNPANNHADNLYWGTPKMNSEDCLRNEGRGRGLTNTRARRAIDMARDGRTVGEIARYFGVTHLTVRNLLSGNTWHHIDGDRVLTEYRSRARVAIALRKLGFSAPDIAVLVEMKKQTVHEVLSRARRLGELPRDDAKPSTRKAA